MIWGCTSWLGVGGINRLEKKLNSELLIGILNTYLVTTVKKAAINLFSNARNKVIFQQDSDLKHTSWAAKDRMASTGMNNMNLPSQSFDLNPIEHLWYLVNCRL